MMLPFNHSSACLRLQSLPASISRLISSRSNGIRTYAQRTSARLPKEPLLPPRPAPKPRVIPSTPSPIPIKRNIGPTAFKREYAASRLYNSGVRNIYTAPSHIGMRATSYTLASICFGWTLQLALSGHWNMGDQMVGWQKIITESGFRLGMMCFVAFGCLALWRYKGLVKSIDLKNVHGETLLNVQVRRLLPFMKPKEVLVSASDFSLPDFWLTSARELNVTMLGSGDLRRTGFQFEIKNAAWIVFSRFRSWVFRYGLVEAYYQDGEKDVLLDLHGTFSNQGSDMYEIATGNSAAEAFRFGRALQV